ncbi:MAG: hypothetical protein V4582_19540 [Pseudomonadota bacterium]
MNSRLRRIFGVLVLLYFSIALFSPMTSFGYILQGTDFERMERDQLIAALSSGFVLLVLLLKESFCKCNIKVGKAVLLAISIATIMVAIVMDYRGHVIGAGLLILQTSIQFRVDNLNNS